jgi:hypothetical protein
LPELVDEAAERQHEEVTPEERRQVIGLLIRLFGAILAVIVAACVALLLTRGDSGSSSFGGKVTLVNAIGPLSGRDVPQYLAERKRDLKAPTDVRAAVISLGTYRKEADVRRLLGGLNVRALLAAAPGGRPEVVPGDLKAWAAGARQAAASERAEFERLIPTFSPKDEKEFIDDAKAQIARLQKLEKAVSGDGEVVFAALVVAPADELRRLGDTTGVRLVDVGTGPSVPELGRVRGLRPEETTVTGEPLTRPA